MLDRQAVKKAKTLLYAYRVVLTGIHLMRTGEVQADLRELNRDFDLPFLDDLIQRKQARELGELEESDWTWHRDELARWATKLDKAYQATTLPDQPPWKELNHFLLELRMHSHPLAHSRPGFQDEMRIN